MNKKRTLSLSLFLRIPLFERKRRLQESTTGGGRDDAESSPGAQQRLSQMHGIPWDEVAFSELLLVGSTRQPLQQTAPCLTLSASCAGDVKCHATYLSCTFLGHCSDQSQKEQVLWERKKAKEKRGFNSDAHSLRKITVAFSRTADAQQATLIYKFSI